ncbi:SGNH/GDSL hydrolase family protein [Paenibacillus sp. FSL H8-0259]|uniref:SGNH/GDSL hydrolase family protein n=1 Tax=Paenibacillus sp. FSL H8-0259 TaxID=1920423 RepID=UPI00096FACF7|nr:SGNH/GDSL hydrolase family protein [Paenibacillus sp. FSL H8-0259]OMF21893.1 hypothetical protein BK132_31685 [Paenibacillus sp. FSL H8-0259]
MAQVEMFPAVANSPATELTAALTDIATTVSVLDASKLPDAPNIATIGVDESAETIKYTGKSGNDLTGVTRGFSGTTAKAWATGVGVARYFTAYDADALRENVADVTAQLADVAYGGQASLYGVEPTGADQTAELNAYFEELADKGVRYAMFDKPGTFVPESALSGTSKVLKIGNAEISKKNPVNWFTHISKTFRGFSGKINASSMRGLTEANDMGSFRRVAEALSQNQPVKVCFFGDSISTAGWDTANLKLRSVKSSTNPLGYINGPDASVESAAYPIKLMDMLVNSFPDTTFKYSNFSIGGETINNWGASRTILVDGVWTTKTWIDMCKDTAPDLLVISFGMNHVNNDQARVFSYYLKTLLDYVKANFAVIPDIVVLTSPRCAYLPGETTWGTYTSHASIHAAANAARAISQEYGAYVCDVARITDIKRMGVDLTRPMLKKMSVTDFNKILTGVTDNGDGTYSFINGASLSLAGNLQKDFQLKLKLNFNVLGASTGHSLTLKFNKTNPGFYDNAVIFYPKFTSNLAKIDSAMRIADNAHYTTFITGSYADTVAYESVDVVLTITKQGPIVEIKLGDNETRIIKDYADCWDVPGTLDMLYTTGTAGESLLVKSIEVWGAEYPEYLPVLLDREMFGAYAAGDYSVKQPYGGNGVNHPSSIGIEEGYVPALAELVEDIKHVASIRNRNTDWSLFPVTETKDSVDSGKAGYSRIALGSITDYPILTARLVSSGGTVYKLQKAYNASVYDHFSLLGTNEFGIYNSGGVTTIIINAVAATGWVVTTHRRA